MSKTSRTIFSFLIGATVGAAVGYILATDKEARNEDMEKIKKTLGGLKTKFAAKKGLEVDEENIYHS